MGKHIYIYKYNLLVNADCGIICKSTNFPEHGLSVDDGTGYPWLMKHPKLNGRFSARLVRFGNLPNLLVTNGFASWGNHHLNIIGKYHYFDHRTKLVHVPFSMSNNQRWKISHPGNTVRNTSSSGLLYLKMLAKTPQISMFSNVYRVYIVYMMIF